jgi:hypothetical protein
MTRNPEDPVDRNVARLVRHWADPPGEERTARARRAFLDAAAAPVPESPSQRRRGLIVTAAGLLICAGVYGSLFLAGPLRGSPGQSQDEAKIKSWIESLGNADVARRDQAALELAAIGAKARPQLEEAVRGSNAEIRVRARDVIDRMAARAKNGPADARDQELANQRTFAAILAERINTLDAECSEKAKRINDLQRQLDASRSLLNKQQADQTALVRQLEVQLAQIAELQKKLEEARKKE